MDNAKTIMIQPSTLELVDQAMFNFIENMTIFATTNKGWKKVPTIWVSAERAYHVKRKKELRDSAGAVILPLITLDRVSASKDTSKAPWGNVPNYGDEKGGAVVVGKRIKQDKTANFQNASATRDFDQNTFPTRGPSFVSFDSGAPINDRVVYEVVSVPQPIYLNMVYKIGIKAEYQQQMNDIIAPFVIRTGNIKHFYIKAGDHRYEAFFESDLSFSNNAAMMGQEERKYETNITVSVLGYLMGSGKNGEQPKATIRESAAALKFTRERVITGEVHSAADKDGFYRE